MRCCDLNQRVEGLLLVVLRDDLRQQCVLALRQLDEGADAVDVRVDLNVKDVVFPWQEMWGRRWNRKHIRWQQTLAVLQKTEDWLELTGTYRPLKDVCAHVCVGLMTSVVLSPSRQTHHMMDKSKHLSQPDWCSASQRNCLQTYVKVPEYCSKHCWGQYLQYRLTTSPLKLIRSLS